MHMFKYDMLPGDIRKEAAEGCDKLRLPTDAPDLVQGLTPSQKLDMLCSYCQSYKDKEGRECFFDSVESEGEKEEKCHTRYDNEISTQCEGNAASRLAHFL